MFSDSGGLRPPTPTEGFAPGPHWGYAQAGPHYKLALVIVPPCPD